MHGTGTYFASALDHFLRSVLAPGLATADGAPRAKTFVVFPDGGAHKRFYTMVHTRLFAGLPYDHILWIKKTRVGADITQADGFNYVDEAGAERAYAAGTFPAGAHVILADDFTQSGSTLMGGARMIRARAGPGTRVSAYVSHFVAKYDRATVRAFSEKLHGAGSPLDHFYCTDSIPNVVRWLRDDCAGRPGPSKVHVMPIAPLVAQWIKAHPLAGRKAPRAGAPRADRAALVACGVALGVALGFLIGRRGRR